MMHVSSFLALLLAEGDVLLGCCLVKFSGTEVALDHVGRWLVQSLFLLLGEGEAFGFFNVGSEDQTLEEPF